MTDPTDHSPDAEASNDADAPSAGLLARGLTGVYTVAATGIAGLGSWWLRSSGRCSAESLKERWGRNLPDAPVQRPIWIHAASMGEVRVAGFEGGVDDEEHAADVLAEEEGEGRRRADLFRESRTEEAVVVLRDDGLPPVEEFGEEGKVPGQKVGRHWRFHRDRIDRWLSEEKRDRP